VEKGETLEQSLSLKESELAQALQTANEAREEAQAALKDFQEVWKIAAGKGFFVISRYLTLSQGRFMVTH